MCTVVCSSLYHSSSFLELDLGSPQIVAQAANRLKDGAWFMAHAWWKRRG
jgi:hypothetical protein